MVDSSVKNYTALLKPRFFGPATSVPHAASREEARVHRTQSSKRRARAFVHVLLTRFSRPYEKSSLLLTYDEEESYVKFIDASRCRWIERYRRVEEIGER